MFIATNEQLLLSSVPGMLGLLPGGKAAGVALTTHRHLTPRLKKE